MKLFLLSVLMLISSVVDATQNTSILQLLKQMNEATKQMDYEVYYVRVSKNNIEPMRYRYAKLNGQRYAHLVYLSGSTREMIRRNDEVTYFEPGFDPYTVASEQIVAPLPVLSRNFTRLMKQYDFVSLGRAREAGLPSYVVRISPKDSSRYSYVLWIDEKTKLLLRADLVDKDGELLEQTRSLKLTVSPSVTHEMQGLAEIKLPPAMKQSNRTLVESNWLIEALPKGFLLVAHHSYHLLNSKRPVENLMYSDGLFSFSVYFSQADEFSLREKLVRSGRRSLYSLVKGGVEITIVGEIPPSIAEQVVKSIRVKPPVSASKKDIQGTPTP